MGLWELLILIHRLETREREREREREKKGNKLIYNRDVLE
jgi:hypothetical protein